MDFSHKHKTETDLSIFSFYFPKFGDYTSNFEEIFFEILETMLIIISKDKSRNFPLC
jgi:hypothetical protein